MGGSCFLTESTGASDVAGTPAISLEQRVRSISKVDDAPELITLLQRVFVFDPLRRPDVLDLLNHPWFVGSSDPSTPSEPAFPVTLPPSPDFATSYGSAAAYTSDDESYIDFVDWALHDTFYLEDGNVEVLCENTLFRVHATTMSFQSPALRRMFARANLATAESPHGCPRLLSKDTPEDFATLLKIIYLPEFVAPPAYR